MKQSIGSTFLLNFIVIFLVVTFAFIMGIISYMKAFRINSGIANAIENHEGYNRLAKTEIKKYLIGYGYRKDNSGSDSCLPKNGQEAKKSAYNEQEKGQEHHYCIYEYSVDATGKKKANGRYFKYGIITYIYIDLPVVGETLEIPVYSETEKIFKFNANEQ